MRSGRGFSLIEVLLAVALLAVGVGIASTALRGAVESVRRAESLADRTDEVRSAQRFIRRQLSATQTVAWPFVETGDPMFDERTMLQGERDSLRFVSNMPGYMSQGGPYVQTFRLQSDGAGLRLEFEHALLIGDQLIADPDRESIVLLDGIAEAGFEYLGEDDSSEPTGWQDEWPYRFQLPKLVRLDVRFEDVARRWPPLTIDLRLAESGSAFTPRPVDRTDRSERPGGSRRPLTPDARGVR